MQDKSNPWASRDCFTIDPSKVGKAMEKLSIDPWPHMIGMFPQILNESLIETLKERGHIKS